MIEIAKDQVQITFKVFNEEFNSAMREMKESTTQLNREFRLQKEQMKLSGSETDKLRASVDYLGKRYEDAKERVKLTQEQLEKAKQTFGENSKEVKNLEAQLINAQIQEQRFANELAIATNELRLAEDPLNRYGKSLQETGKKLQDTGKKMTEIGKDLTKKITLPIVGIGTMAAKASIDFESAFAGVRKTVDASEKDFKKLEKGIRDMSKEIPSSATAIAGVAEAAGQLGIETDNILGFTRVMIDLGESTNMSADEAATSLARLANITGMSQKDFDRLGSTIVDLGNNLATTEGEIVAMGLRLAGAGKQIGLTEAQTMSFAGALSSVGIEAEAGGSAFSKVMIEMQLAVETNSKKLNDFAKVAGMSGKDFQRAFKEDAAGAIISFIQGLGSAEERGMSAIKVLDDMGITEVRLRDSLLRAAGASDVFTGALELGTQAWDENNALTKEAEQRYVTTESKLKIAKNTLVDAGKTIGDIIVPHLVTLSEKIKNAAEWFSNLSPSTQETIVKLGALAAAVGPVLSIFGPFLSIIGKVTSGFGGLMKGIAEAGSVSAFLAPKITTLKSVFAMLTGPIGITVAAVAAFAAIAVVVYKNWDGIKEFFVNLWEGIKTAFSTSIEFIGNFLSTAWTAIANFFVATWEVVTWPVQMAWEIIKSIIQSALAIIEGVIGTILNTIKHVWQIAWESIKEKVSPIWNSIRETISDVINKVKSIIETILNNIKTFMSNIWNNIKTTTTNIWNNIKEAVSGPINTAKEIVSNVVNTIKNTVSNIFNSVKTTVSNIWNNIKEAISGPINTARETVSSTVNSIKSTVGNAFNSVKTTASNIWNGIKSAIETPINAARDTVSRAIDAIKGFFNNLKLKFPDIKPPKLPKFSLEGKFSLAPPSVPKVSVSWKSEGAIFRRPTVLNGIGVGDGYKGLGSGMEAVLPISKLSGIMRDTLLGLLHRVIPAQYAQFAGATGSTTINFNGNYQFRDDKDIDYFMSRAETLLKRRDR